MLGAYGKRPKRSSLGKFVWRGLVVALVLALAATTVIYRQKYEDLKRNPAPAVQSQNDQLLAQVGHLTKLPTGQQPTIATVNDLSALKSQPFFADARVGDKIILYSNARRIILYRPSTNKIINDGTVASN